MTGDVRLGIDLDGVVTDFTKGWVEIYNRDFDAHIQVGDVVTWSAPVKLTHFKNMSQFWRWARTCGDGKSLFRVLTPYPGALAGLNSLVRRGHELVIITTKPSFATNDTYEWLAEHEVPATEVHLIDDKASVFCDLYVDDASHNLRSYRDRRSGSVIVRWVQPWNKPLDGVVDAESWPEVLSLANGLL